MPNLKKYLWQKLKTYKPYISTKPITNKLITFVILDICMTIIAIYNQMVII